MLCETSRFCNRELCSSPNLEEDLHLPYTCRIRYCKIVVYINRTADGGFSEMPVLRTLFTLPPTISSALTSHVYARPDGVTGADKGPPRPTCATALTGGEGCSFSDIGSIRSGFSDMTVLLSPAVPFRYGTQSAIEFFGSSILANYTDLIASNLQRAPNYGILDGEEGPVNADIHIRCDDPMDLCDKGNRREGDHAAYNIGNVPHIVFCSDYFRMDDLNDRIHKKADNRRKTG
jgi:hypothetical protein